MRVLKKIFLKLVEWFQPRYNAIYVDEIPENIKGKVIYIVGDAEYLWTLAFKCPCGCQNVIQLNLLKDATPCWSFEITNGKKINISPSIWRTTGCKSHFFVRKSKVIWVSNCF